MFFKFALSILIHIILHFMFAQLNELFTNSIIRAGLLTTEFSLLLILGFEFIKFILDLYKGVVKKSQQTPPKISRH